MEPHRHHAAEPPHLTGRHLVPRMVGKPRVQYRSDLRVRVQQLCHGLRVCAVPIHAQIQGFQSADRQKGVKRAGDRTRAALQKLDFLIQLGVVTHHHATDNIRMPTQVLGGGMHHHVRTQRQRLLQIRGGERVIHRH